jgi:hypothetical protein
MKVVLQTPSQLVLHDGALGTVFMGTLFLVVGGGAIALWIADPSGWSGNAGPWLIYFVGGVFILVGIGLLALSADRRYVIDRAAGTARIIVQRVLHRRSSEYPLTDLQDVALERSPGGSNQGSYYRIVFLTKSGSRVPWTPFSTNDEGNLSACASAVRRFCGWTGHEAPPPAPPLQLAGLSGHPVATNWGCVGAFLSIFAAAGLGFFGAEVVRVATWNPVTASVLSTDIKVVRGNKGSSYMPVVQYQYQVAGVAYSSSRVLPIDISASHDWAERMITRFQAGETVTAYVNPRDPAKAFLVRKVSLLPLIFVAFPIAMVALLAWIVRVQRRQLEAVETYPVPIVEA